MAAAKKACQLDIKKAKVTYPDIGDMGLPYLCMDLTYTYTLLVDGFGKLRQALTFCRDDKKVFRCFLTSVLSNLNFRHCSFGSYTWCITAGLQPMKKITFVDKVKHGEYYIEAAWPLGTAIEAVAPKKMPGN